MNKDSIKNYYELIDKNLQKKPKLDATFKNHHILPNSMILCIGSTGAGKTNSLMEFLSRKNNAFYEILLYTGSTTDEPLYNYLQKQIPDMQVFNNINDFPSLNEFDNEDKEKEKLAIFDDFINLNKKEMVKINEYLTSGRKYGFTCWLMAQSYTAVPKIITRNCNYFIIFKLNDNVTINCILKNHNIHNVESEIFRDAYFESIKEPRNFFMVDLKGGKLTHMRNNFLNFLPCEKTLKYHSIFGGLDKYNASKNKI